MSESYKEIYKSMRSEKIYLFMATITANRAAKAMSNACMAMEQVEKCFSKLGKAIRESEVVNQNGKYRKCGKTFDFK